MSEGVNILGNRINRSTVQYPTFFFAHSSLTCSVTHTVLLTCPPSHLLTTRRVFAKYSTSGRGGAPGTASMEQALQLVRE